MRQRKRFRASVVITVAGSFAQSMACGGSTVGEKQLGTEDAGAGGEGSGGEGTGGEGSGGNLIGAGGAGGAGGAQLAACPTEPDPTVGGSLCPPAGRCTMDFTCASGPETFVLECGPAVPWSVDATCDLAHDHCVGFAGQNRQDTDCVAGQWQLRGIGGNPPAPCPEQRPVVGASCRPGGFGGDPDHCGYRCADGTGWTVLSCTPSGTANDAGIVPTAWQSDGACD